MIQNKSELISYIERVEKLEEDKAGLSSDVRDILAEAKSKGFEPKVIRRIVKDRKKKPDQLREENDTYDVYAVAAGLVNPN